MLLQFATQELDGMWVMSDTPYTHNSEVTSHTKKALFSEPNLGISVSLTFFNYVFDWVWDYDFQPFFFNILSFFQKPTV